MIEEKENIEEILKKHNVIGQNDTIENFFLLPYDEIFKKLQTFFISLRNYFKPIPEKQSDRLFFYVLYLITFSDFFYAFQKSIDNYEIKTNAKRIINDINNLIIKELSPYILSFFNWDFNRRIWKKYNNGYKTEYIKSTILEIDNEIKGNSEAALKKYIELFFEFILENLDKILKDFHEIQHESLIAKKNDAYKFRNDLSEILENNKLNEFIDSALENQFLDLYKPIANSFIEGIIKSNGRFDYLLYSFIDAQSQYKNLLENQLKITENIDDLPIADLKNALSKKEIKYFINKLNTYFASVPNVLIKNTNEAFYHIFIHIILKLLGCDIQSEVQTNVGRIDAVLKTNNYIYVIEFKISSAQKAMKQIEDRKYSQQFANPHTWHH